MRKHHFYITFFSLLWLFVFSVGVVFARGTSETTAESKKEWEEKAEERKAEFEVKAEERKKEFEERKSEREAKTEEFVARRCEQVTERIQYRIEKANQNHERFVGYYTSLDEKIQAHLKRLKEKGCDVSISVEDMATLNGLLAGLEVEHQKYIDEMDGTEEFACGESDGDFKTALRESQDQLKIVKKKAIDLRNFVRTTLRETLKDQINACNLTRSDDAARSDDSEVTEEESL